MTTKAAPATVQEHYWRAYTTYLLAQKGSELEQNMRQVLMLYSALWPETFPHWLPGGSDEKASEAATAAD